MQEAPVRATQTLAPLGAEARAARGVARLTRVVAGLELAGRTVRDALCVLQVVAMVTLDADRLFVDAVETGRSAGPTRPPWQVCNTFATELSPVQLQGQNPQINSERLCQTFEEEVSRRTAAHTHSLPLQHQPTRQARQTVLADVTTLALRARDRALVAGARRGVDVGIGLALGHALVVGHASQVTTAPALERVRTRAAVRDVTLLVTRDGRRLLQRDLQRDRARERVRERRS